MPGTESGETEGGIPPDYLLDMLLSLSRVARAAGQPFLAFLIEMAALEAARLKELRTVAPEGGDPAH